MSIKHIRRELDALRNQLTGPASVQEPSAIDAIEARLDRLAERMKESGEPIEPMPEARREFAAFWLSNFGVELRS